MKGGQGVWAILTILTVLGCSSGPDGSKVASSGVKEAYLMSSPGVCQQQDFKIATVPTANQKAGACPNTVVVDGGTVGIIKTCDSFVDGNGDTETFVQYSKDVVDGKVIDINDTSASINCDHYKSTLGAATN